MVKRSSTLAVVLEPPRSPGSMIKNRPLRVYGGMHPVIANRSDSRIVVLPVPFDPKITVKRSVKLIRDCSDSPKERTPRMRRWFKVAITVLFVDFFI